MGMMITFIPKKKTFFAERPEDVTSLVRGFYGTKKKGKIILAPEEALFIMDIRNGRCIDERGNEYSFNDILKQFANKYKFSTRYFAYKGWRDRGLIVRPATESKGHYGRSPVKRYPSGKMDLSRYSTEGVFCKDALMTVVEDQLTGRELYDKYWFGQYGTYKAEKRGKITKYDIYETIFLMKNSVLKLVNYDADSVFSIARKRNRFFDLMYDVYEDWRMRGYILKTGFKFGTHFRLYFPGAGPKKKGREWVHSKHVVHVFPKRRRQSISEWSRAIRVAHSVRKTFIQALPGESGGAGHRARLDYLLYHRKKGRIETPKKDRPKYMMLSLNEEEYIDGRRLASAIEECKENGLQLLIAICDRETAITYYLVKRIELPKSKYKYYEIEWILP